MRSRGLAIVAALPTLIPLVDAISFANFQQITSASIPIRCQLKYDATISSCTVADFEDLCSAACISGINDAAQTVVNACEGVSVSAVTLLGIILNGNQIAALCRTNTKSSTAPAAKTSTAAIDQSVTIPTSSGGVQVSTMSSSFTITSSKQSFSSIPTFSSALTFTSTMKTTTASTTIASLSSTAPATIPTMAPQAQTASTSTTTKNDGATTSRSKTGAKATDTSQGQQQGVTNSGGGSPFDIQGTASNIRIGTALNMLALGAWASFFVFR